MPFTSPEGFMGCWSKLHLVKLHFAVGSLLFFISNL